MTVVVYTVKNLELAIFFPASMSFGEIIKDIFVKYFYHGWQSIKEKGIFDSTQPNTYMLLSAMIWFKQVPVAA